jgi:uncharacterized caspase-like protein
MALKLATKAVVVGGAFLLLLASEVPAFSGAHVVTPESKDLVPAGPAAALLVPNAMEYLEKDNYASAEKLMKTALDQDAQGGKEKSFDLANHLSSLGLIYLRQGKYGPAEECYKRSLSIVESLLGKEDSSTAVCLNNLANLYFNEGEFGKAEDLCQQGLLIREGVYGNQHPKYAQNLMNLARILAAQANHEECVKLLLLATAIDEQKLDANDEDLVPAWWQLGEAYEALHQYPAAETWYKKLLMRDERVLGQSNPALLGDLIALASVTKAQRKDKEASDYQQRVNLIRGKIPGGNVTSVIRDLSNASDSVPFPVADKWALIVGISNFKNGEINLKYAAKDATDFRNYLVAEGKFKADHVKLLTDGEATRENIIASLGEKWLARAAHRNDLVVIYVSSHGAQVKDAGNASFIVPYEGTLENIVLTGIPLNWITVGVRDSVPCDRVLLVLDVCHGGAVQLAEPADDDQQNSDIGPIAYSKDLVPQSAFKLNDASVARNQVVLASSQSEQLSWESKNYPNGVFTKRLIEGLRQKGSLTTMSDAYEYLKQKVEEEVLRDRAAIQTPVLLTKLRGGQSLLLQVEPTAPRTAPIEATTESLSTPKIKS